VILIYGRLDDPPLARTVEALQEAGAAYVLLEQMALGREDLRIDVGRHGVDGVLVAAGQAVALESISSVYARPLALPSRAFSAAEVRRAQWLHEQLFEWLDIATALVVNRPRAMNANASKPLQAQLIGAAGFVVPETLVTSDRAEAQAFRREHGRVVFKSASGVRSIVRELDEQALPRLSLLSALPVQFQAYVPGVDMRVHVVGRRTFASAIQSPAIDYRYAMRDGAEASLTPTDLPDSVAARCVALARQMELPLAGIDLRRRPDGVYVCFEVNPMPAYTYFETQTSLPIAQALAELLIDSGVRKRSRAMVQVIENLSQIRGKIVARAQHPTLDNYDVVTVQVERVETVPGKANILQSLLGGTVNVTVRRGLLGNAGPGAGLRCRAKRTPDGAMCEPHPPPGEFEITQ
jgi:glutathione synthase/RimK-type ligase-like ATP-grasp enzyme